MELIKPNIHEGQFGEAFRWDFRQKLVQFRKDNNRSTTSAASCDKGGFAGFVVRRCNFFCIDDIKTVLRNRKKTRCRVKSRQLFFSRPAGGLGKRNAHRFKLLKKASRARRPMNLLDRFHCVRPAFVRLAYSVHKNKKKAVMEFTRKSEVKAALHIGPREDPRWTPLIADFDRPHLVGKYARNSERAPAWHLKSCVGRDDKDTLFNLQPCKYQGHKYFNR